MNEEKKDKFPWEMMDTTTLMLPEELLAYHLYRLNEEKKTKREKGIKDQTALVSSYRAREIEKEEKSPCFQK